MCNLISSFLRSVLSVHCIVLCYIYGKQSNFYSARHQHITAAVYFGNGLHNDCCKAADNDYSLTCRMWWFSRILLQLRSSGKGSRCTSAFDRIFLISLTLTIWQTQQRLCIYSLSQYKATITKLCTCRSIPVIYNAKLLIHSLHCSTAFSTAVYSKK